MNASPLQGLYPLSPKAVITLSALDFLFAACCGKVSRRRIRDRSMIAVRAKMLSIQLAWKLKVSAEKGTGKKADVQYATCRFGSLKGYAERLP